MGRLAGYKYRKSITLFRESGVITDYQMRIYVDESSGSYDPNLTGMQVSCEGNCLPNFNDSRFTKEDGTTLLDYWIESISGTTPNQVATVWINFDSIGATGTTFYMYYGNAGAAAGSSGEDTFPFFDDFPGSSIDGAKWPTIQGANWSVAGEILSCTPATAGSACFIKSALALGFGYRIRAKANLPQLAGSKSASIGYWIDANNNAMAEIYSNEAYWGYSWTVGGTVTRDNAPHMWSSGYHILELQRASINLTYYMVDDSGYGHWNGGFSSDVYPVIYTYESTLSVDWIFICKVFDDDIDSEGWSDQEEFEDCAESVTITDVPSGAGSIYSSNELDEEAIIGDVADADEHYNITINETIGLAETIVGVYRLTISEQLFAWEEIINGWYVTNDESLVFTDTQTIVLGLLISDWLTLIDTQSNNWNGREIVNQTLNLYDVAVLRKNFYDTVDESLVVSNAPTYALTIAVLEYLRFNDLAMTLRTGASTVNESIVLTDEASRAWAQLINEALSTVDSASVITTFIGAVSEALGIDDTASIINIIYPSVSESLVFDETITTQGTLYSAVYDTLKINVMVEIAGEVYECYVLNTPQFLPSMYSGFDFNSYCVFENRAFGANDKGIYELTGMTDAGSKIHTGVILPETNFGSHNQKRFRRGYLGISGASPVMVFETGKGKRQVYNVDTKGKVVASNELKSKEWKLSIADFDSLDYIKLIPVILSK
jgi:hypothetical protein